MSVTPVDVTVYGSMCMPAYDGAATLNGAIASTSATSVPINAPTSPFPSSGEFAILVDSEIMWVTQGAPGSSAGTLTVVRGICGTTAATHSNAAAVTMPIGGGIDFLTKVSFSDVVSGDLADYQSTNTSDTKVQVTLTGRDTTGVLQSETKTLNGQTVVAGTQAWDRFLKFALAAATTCTNNPLTSAGTTLTVATAANLPASGNYYVQLAKEVMQVTAGQGTASLTVTRAQMGTTATAHASGDNVFLLPLGDIAAMDHTKVVSAHTAQTGSAQSAAQTPTLFKLQAGDGASMALGQLIVTTGGTGPNQIRTIIGLPATYGTDIVAVSRNWGTLPDNTTTYDIRNGMQLDLALNQITACQRFLYNAAADVPGGSTKTFYEEVFVVNNNTATALTSATVQVASNTPSLPGTAALDLALATSLNNTVSAANRQTNFGSGMGSFVVQPSAISVPANSGTLPSGAAPNAAGAEGALLRMTLPAGTAPYKGAADLRTLGQTI